MARYVKLINNEIVDAPTNKDGICNYNLDVALMQKDGYKILIQGEKNSNLPYTISYNESDTEIQEVINYTQTTEEFLNEQLLQTKNDKLDEINLKAYQYEDNGLISYTGVNSNGDSVTVQIETTDKNIGKINGLINMFNAEKITQYIWSTKDDTQIVLKKDDAYNLSGLFAEFSSKIWIEKQPYFKNLVEKATTADEINAIVVDYSLDIPTASV